MTLEEFNKCKDQKIFWHRYTDSTTFFSLWRDGVYYYEYGEIDRTENVGIVVGIPLDGIDISNKDIDELIALKEIAPRDYDRNKWMFALFVALKRPVR
jgi:hypothetical protein